MADEQIVKVIANYLGPPDSNRFLAAEGLLDALRAAGFDVCPLRKDAR